MQKEAFFSAALRRLKRAGQVTVEMLLVLPVLMLLLFSIMEIGNIAYQTILAHHCAYELARIGSLMADLPGGKSGADTRMRGVLTQMFPGKIIPMSSRMEDTVPDAQSGTTAKDLVVTLTYPATLFFPVANYLLSDDKQEPYTKKISVVVRMPVEAPFKK